MRASKFAKAAVTCGVLFLCAFVFIACAEQEETVVQEVKIDGLTGGIAATVNGIEIEEDTVTTYIQKYRSTYGLTNDGMWAQWLIENNHTPQTIRESTINTYISQELIKTAARDFAIEIPSSEIDSYVESVSVYYGDNEAWEKALEKEGITEEEYRESIEVALLQRGVKDAIDAGEDPSDLEIFDYACNHVSSYEGAKKSAHILFSASDSALAEEVLQKIHSNEITFEEAAAQYSTDTGNAQEGGNKGWNVLDTGMSTAYSTALNDLEINEVSGLVTTEYGIHIIKCTGIYTTQGPLIDLSQIPGEFIEDIRTTLETNKKNDAYISWYQGYYDAADIVINEMPENVPYNIDLGKYEEDEKDEGDTPEAGETPDIPGTPEAVGENADEASEVTDENIAGEATDSARELPVEVQ